MTKPTSVPLAVLLALAAAPAVAAHAPRRSGPPSVGAKAAPPHTPSARQRLVAVATALFDQGAFFPDCSTFIEGVFERAHVPLERNAPGAHSLSEAIFRHARHPKRPKPGDIAVFHNTYDRNGDGRWNDRFTHIALVERVLGARVTLLHRGSAGLERSAMNVGRPSDRRQNSVLRQRTGNQPGTKVLTGQLFAGYGSLVDSTPRKSHR